MLKVVLELHKFQEKNFLLEINILLWKNYQNQTPDTSEKGSEAEPRIRAGHPRSLLNARISYFTHSSLCDSPCHDRLYPSTMSQITLSPLRCFGQITF